MLRVMDMADQLQQQSAADSQDENQGAGRVGREELDPLDQP